MFSNFSELAAPQSLLQTTIDKSGYRNVCGLLLHAYICYLPVVVFGVAVGGVTISTAVILVDVVSVVVFSCPEQLNRTHCLSLGWSVPLTPLTIKAFTTLQSDPRDL